MKIGTSPGNRGGAVDVRINVLFLMIQMGMGGSERLILNLVRHLDRRVFSPSVGWFMGVRPLKEFEELGVPLFNIPKVKRVDWSAMRQIGRIVADHRIDVINAHHFMSCFYAYYGTKIVNRAKLVYTEHSKSDVLAAAGKWKTVGRRLLGSCDAVVGVSEPVSRTLESHFRVRRERVHTIENGVDLDLFRKPVEDRARARERLGFSPREVLIGHVANFRHNKNHLFLIRAFHQIASRRSDITLVLVGQGFAGDPENSEPEITIYLREHGLEGRVRLMGYRPDVHELLGILDVFCLVSYTEGLPLSLIEAMASGLPVVGTDIDGIHGLVEPERSGLLVSPDDVPGLTLALERLIDSESLRQGMGMTSRRLATEKYSLKRCVDDTQRLFLSTLPRRSLDCT